MDVVSPNAYLPWYDQRESITKVVFDDSFANCLTLTSTANWFEDCSKLTTIIGIENLKTDNVTYMGGMFYGCSGLSSLDVSGFKTDNVTNMGSMFRNCSGLTKLNVSGIKTDNVTNMAGMFSECSGLSSLDYLPADYRADRRPREPVLRRHAGARGGAVCGCGRF